MTTAQAREILWPEYSWIPDNTVEELIQYVQAVCTYILAMEQEEDQSDCIDHENHELT